MPQPQSPDKYCLYKQENIVLLTPSEICMVARMNFLQHRHKMSVTELYVTEW